MDKQRYMISDAAAAVNVESHVLRYWEDELKLMVPRNEMGHRYYTKENIDEFLKIKELKEQGYQLKAIKMILHNENPAGMDIGQMTPEQLNARVAGAGMSQQVHQMPGNSMEQQVGQETGGNMRQGARYGTGMAAEQNLQPAGAGMNPMMQQETGIAYAGGGQMYQPSVNAQHSGATRLDQFQEMMNEIVKEAIEANNHALGKEVGEQVGDRVLKEMNYLMREQDEQEEARYRKLDEAIRSVHKKKEKTGKLFGKKAAPQPKQA